MHTQTRAALSQSAGALQRIGLTWPTRNAEPSAISTSAGVSESPAVPTADADASPEHATVALLLSTDAN